MLPPPSRAERLALRATQGGALLVVLVALRYKLFELDRFFVPKEVVLHAAAACVAAALLAWPVARRAWSGVPTGPGPRLTWIDAALGAFLLLSAASAAVAQNPWLGLRAAALSAAGATLFWGARALARAGHARAVLGALVAAVALGCATSLAQAYGVDSAYFSLNRAPGGTFGNRNFVAHLAAIGLPLCAVVGLRARKAGAALGAAGAALLCGAVLVMSRSRGAWLGAAASMAPLALALWRARRLTGQHTTLARGALFAVAVAIGGAAAILLPNTLNWKSDSPYLDSVKGVVDYKRGSGGGRLKQYANSARMAAAHPALGVGPGNWPVHYPRFAPESDPSLTDDGVTANPWPSSDWVAMLSERGLAAFAALGLTFAGLLWWAHRATWRGRDADEVLLGGALGAALVATLVVGAFDAVLLLAAPTFIAWSAFGALAVESRAVDDAARPLGWPPAARRLALVLLGAGALLAALRSTAQGVAMALFSTGRSSAIAAAGTLDPGSFRIRLRQAELAAQRGRCAEVREHAGAAYALFPSAPQPRRLLAACGARRRR